MENKEKRKEKCRQGMKKKERETKRSLKQETNSELICGCVVIRFREKKSDSPFPVIWVTWKLYKQGSSLSKCFYFIFLFIVASTIFFFFFPLLWFVQAWHDNGIIMSFLPSSAFFLLSLSHFIFSLSPWLFLMLKSNAVYRNSKQNKTKKLE